LLRKAFTSSKDATVSKSTKNLLQNS